jgi:hypothetical protein
MFKICSGILIFLASTMRYTTIHHLRVPPTMSYLQRLGSKLTSIQINFLCHNLNFVVPLSKIETTCKNLARVDLVTIEWLIPSFSIPKSVHTLGIRVKDHKIPTFFLSIRNVLSSFPSVKTFCFTNQRNIRAFRVHSQAFSSNLAGIFILGVNVMDHEGRLLVVDV